jgi:hypothetical protein
MWSVGVILAELLGGKPIFKGREYVLNKYFCYTRPLILVSVMWINLTKFYTAWGHPQKMHFVVLDPLEQVLTLSPRLRVLTLFHCRLKNIFVPCQSSSRYLSRLCSLMLTPWRLTSSHTCYASTLPKEPAPTRRLSILISKHGSTRMINQFVKA